MSTQLRGFTDALNTQLVAAAITNQIAWPNVVYVPKKGTYYLSVANAGRARAPVGFGADGVQRWTGVYQVGVFAPRDSGDREQDGLASKVLAAFPRGLTLPNTRGSPVIVEFSSAATAVASGDWSQLPVSINWFATETTS